MIPTGVIAITGAGGGIMAWRPENGGEAQMKSAIARLLEDASS